MNIEYQPASNPLQNTQFYVSTQKIESGSTRYAFGFNQSNLVETFILLRRLRSSLLAKIDQLVDRLPMEALFDGVYASREGAASFPILVYFKLLLIQQWHGLSDEQLKAAVDDWLSFRRFCGIPLDRPAPDHPWVWRKRQQLVTNSEDGVSIGERLLAAINAK